MRRSINLLMVILLVLTLSPSIFAQIPIVADHQCTDLTQIPVYWITQAKSILRVGYGHTSHGSQIITGIDAIKNRDTTFNYPYSSWGLTPGVFMNDEWGNAGGANDLGGGGDLAWRDATIQMLNLPDNDRNVVMWSWCGGVSYTDSIGIDVYLQAMDALELQYPAVRFVYMTGHLDGTGVSGNLNLMNDRIRSYCYSQGKILFDFADIESYDPDRTTNYMELMANDNCDYDSSGVSRNWAQVWIAGNSGSTLEQEAANVCGSCCAHSQGLNCVLKGRAFWWLMARLAGWVDSSMTMSRGWNLVSVPRLQSDYSAEILFPGKLGGMYAYNSAAQEYVAAATLENGPGYWVYYSNTTSVTMGGSETDSLLVSTSSPGWILIGSCSIPVQISSLVLSDGAVINGNAYRYNAVSGVYDPVTMVNPGDGVWINVSTACTISYPY